MKKLSDLEVTPTVNEAIDYTDKQFVILRRRTADGPFDEFALTDNWQPRTERWAEEQGARVVAVHVMTENVVYDSDDYKETEG